MLTMQRFSPSRDDGLPLLVRHLVDDAVPGVAGVVDDDVDLAVAKLGGLVDEQLDVGLVEDVAGHADGLAARLVNGLGDGRALLWHRAAARAVMKLTGINVRHDNLGALIGKQASRLGADSLAAAGDDGDLPGKEALGVVEVAGDLRHAVRHAG
ncbi:hypothetical protein NLG97_g9913 [Lecanicillium saksenae]|uniref:Uncharacterized protein n=1 Tax=Lecanicillium saksenae TaxID=468837 RepID=A0ACC1QFZ7_9HYPO|nr:hypothetical protein NLG97_g9913 [Lecanicillium saksenae]